MKMTKMLKDLAEENKSPMSAKVMGVNMIYDSDIMDSRRKIFNVIYDSGDDSEGKEVLEMLELMMVLSKCNKPLSAQDVGNIMFGVNGTSAEFNESVIRSSEDM
jgi:hypothetical protein